MVPSEGVPPRKKPPGRATAAVGCGLVLLIVAIFIAPMNLRDVSIFLNRDEFVRDEFEVDYFSQGTRSQSFGGHVVSTGESLSTHNDGLIIPGGLAGRRELQEEKRLVGHRFPVWYLPRRGFWGFVDQVSPFRVISAEVFEAPDPPKAAWLGVAAGFWVTGILLLRWGVRLAKKT
jgi:hypothetical protein